MTTETIPLTQDEGGARPDGPGASRFATGADTVSAHSGDAPSRERGGEFAGKPTAALAAQCRMQARENLDPEYSQFMFAVADRLQGFAASKSQGAPSADWQLAYAIEWANRSVDSVKERMWAVEDALDGLVASLANTGFHNSIEMAAARKLLARDSDRNPEGGDACGSVHESAGRTASPQPEIATALKGEGA